MNGINLHHVVRGAITAIHPDETVQIYINTGQQNDWGTVTPTYAGPIEAKAQIQSESDSALFHSNRVGMNAETCKAYFYQRDFNRVLLAKKLFGFEDAHLQPFDQAVFSDGIEDTVPAHELSDLSRFKERGGDMFQRADGSWWLITAITDNFSSVGWVNVRAALQVNPPQNIIPVPNFYESKANG